ncbi:MAG: protein kinase domain-containing protein [Steroidobacteraceae bacterium]
MKRNLPGPEGLAGMNEPIAGQPRPDADLHVAQNWLDALSTGACDENTFLRAVEKLAGQAPDLGWDLLSLLDQYYRRGKIAPEVFLTVKAHLEVQLLGTALDVESNVPLPQTGDTLSPAGQSAPIIPSATRRAVRPPPTAQADTACTPDAIPPMITEIAASTARGARREIAIGDVLRGRYRIASVLGRGGTGTIFEAIDQYRLDLPNAGQRLAIKVPHSAVAERPELLTELRREFQHLQSLSHPNIVRVHEYDRDGDTAFFTMEYLSGLSLSRVLSARPQIPLDRSHALTIIREVGAALAHAHGHSVVHGDLNPGNIFITYDGDVRVLDFGAAHAAQHRSPAVSDVGGPEQKPIATPRYASCQLLEGEPADVRDDVYALACVSYVLLAGQHPFGEHTAIHARALSLTAARPAGLTWGQWQALRAGLSFDRDHRPAHVEEWLKPFGLRAASDRLPALPALLKLSSPKRGRMRMTALTAGVLAILAVGWWVAANFESVTRATALSTGLSAAFGTAESLLTKPWHSTPHTGREEIGAGANPPAIPSPTPATSAKPPAIPAPASVPIPASASSSPSAPQAAAATRLAAASSHAASGTASRSRIEMAANTVDVPPADPTAHVVVHRSGNLHGDASFSWWTESGTAKPEQDFAPVAAHEERIGDGKSAVSLLVPVVADPTRHQSKSFYVVISDPSPGASLGHRTVTMVTISPAG